MKKALYVIIISFIFIVILSGCSMSSLKQDLIGTWLMSDLENRDTGEPCDYDSELYILNKNGTGYDVLMPCEYYEELYYITWYAMPLFNEVKVKYYEDFVDSIMIKQIESDKMTCYINYQDGDEVLRASASFKRIDDAMSPLIGCWWLYEKYENEEYVEYFEEYLYLYPNGDMLLKYWNNKWIENNGEWIVNDDVLYINLFSNNGDSTELSRKYETTSNTLRLIENNDDKSEIISIYKREFGTIMNSPPSNVKTSSVTKFLDVLN